MFGAGRHGRVGADKKRYRTTLVQLATWTQRRKLHGTLRTLRGTPERPKGWVSRKLHGTLRTCRIRTWTGWGGGAVSERDSEGGHWAQPAPVFILTDM